MGLVLLGTQRRIATTVPQRPRRRRPRARRSSTLVMAGMLLPAVVPQAAGVQQFLTEASAALSVDDLAAGGSCASSTGCRREAVSARAFVIGKPPAGVEDCLVVKGNAAEGFTMADTEGAVFGVVHRCEDASGALLDQVCVLVASLLCVADCLK